MNFTVFNLSQENDFWVGLTTVDKNDKTKSTNRLKNKRLVFGVVLEAGLEPARRLNAKGF